ncbi:MAG: aminotransferase class V-fold PLP-dependent enzyme [Haliea sp.]|jgi:selenocysteine lyase/cysteine desulfurase|nr:aminotransferase class V-fold PLP-dependent enzyme [Haliea sp.]
MVHLDESSLLPTAVQAEFSASNIYLDTATMGLPPRATQEEMRIQLASIADGSCDATAFDIPIGRARAAFSRIVQCPVDQIAIIPAVSVATGVVAAHLRPGQKVLMAEEDFTSVLFPFLRAQREAVETVVVPLESVIDRVADDIDWVAVSAVQSSDGRRLDLDSLADACDAHGVRSYIDLTQAAGWVEADATRFDVTATGLYKWLLSPRGTGFMTVRPELWDSLQPTSLGWYAGQEPWRSIYRPPLREADNARRYDISPAWLCWAGAAPALELIADLGPAAIGRHNLALANHFRSELGLEAGISAVVSLPLADERIEAARERGVAFAGRDGRSRFSFHLCNGLADVEAALAAIT